jgi:CubicO group peptidase (beta-lactamase class C family)
MPTSSRLSPGIGSPSSSSLSPAAGVRRDATRPLRSSPLACAQRSFSAPMNPVLTDDGEAVRRASEPIIAAQLGAGPRSALGEAEPDAVADTPADPNGNSAAAIATLQRTLAVLREQMDVKNWHTGAMVSVIREGGEQLDVAVGEVRPGVPMNGEALLNWMSTSKVVAVIAIAQLLERCKLGSEKERVCKYVPEFGRYGKELITIEHLLLHTAGIPYADVSMWSKMHLWDEVIATICEAKVEDGMNPGTKAAYHPYSAWFLLGEIVRRVDGRKFDVYCREEIFVPLGMTDCYVGMDEATYARYQADGRFAELRTMSPKGKVLSKATVGTQADEVKAVVPGSNGRGPAPQLLRVFECLLLGGVGRNGTRILKPETVEMITRRRRIGMYDVVQGLLCDWSLGLFVRTGDGPQITGRYSTAETYGHGGSQSSVGFCDPVHKLAVVIVCNTRPGPKHHYERMCNISTAVYEDLGLAPTEGATPPEGAAAE